MKKIICTLLLLASSISYAQTTTIKSTPVKLKYENVYYKSPKKFNNKEQKFVVNSIEFSSNYKGSQSKNIYQISIRGKVNNKSEQVIYNAKSIEELEYYAKLFKGRYTKILLFENDYYISSKKYFDTSIVVEY